MAQVVVKLHRADGDVQLGLKPYGLGSQRRGPIRPETKGCSPQKSTVQRPGVL